MFSDISCIYLQNLFLSILFDWLLLQVLVWETERDYTWTSSDGQYRKQTDFVLCSQRWRISIQSAKTRPVTNCGSHLELLIPKFWLKLKKVGKSTKPFQVLPKTNPLWLYGRHSTVGRIESNRSNRFKGLDLLDRVLNNYGWRFMTLY